jgi:hypothetical protein
MVVIFADRQTDRQTVGKKEREKEKDREPLEKGTGAEISNLYSAHQGSWAVGRSATAIAEKASGEREREREREKCRVLLEKRTKEDLALLHDGNLLRLGE